MAIGCSIDECDPDCEARNWCRRLGIYQRFERTAGRAGRPVTNFDGVVQIAYLHREQVSHSWADSMRRMWEYDLDHGRIARKPLNLRCGAGMVSHTRNYGARLFLDKTEHEWLFWCDTDMGFEPDAVHRLLAVADPVERPVVGGLCFAFMEAAYDGMGGWRRTIVPTMYKIGTQQDSGEPSFCYYGDYEPDTVTQVAATGGAFILIHRSVLEKLRAEHGDHWYDMVYDRAGDIVGEDIAFCGRVLKAGIVPVVHTGVQTTHHKEVWLGEMDYILQQAVQLQPYPDLTVAIDLEKSFGALARHEHDHDGMLKLRPDLDRYDKLIEATCPEVIVETGTHTGASAEWFARRGRCEVVTVDLTQPGNAGHQMTQSASKPTIYKVEGNSADPDIAAKVAELVAGRRCMVVLDSEHSAPHVAREIELYGPLVTPGCYLVVEDAIFGYGAQIREQHGMAHLDGTALDAIAKRLVDNPDWSRDLAIERTDPVSSNPAGYWVRNG